MSTLDLKLLRELTEELGYQPATTDPEHIAELRRHNAAADAAGDREHVVRKNSHFGERKRQQAAEEAARRDLDENPVRPCAGE